MGWNFPSGAARLLSSLDGHEFRSYLQEDGAAFTARDHHTQTHHSLLDTVWDLHVLGGHERGELLEALHETELPAELGAEEEEEQLGKSRSV